MTGVPLGVKRVHLIEGVWGPRAGATDAAAACCALGAGADPVVVLGPRSGARRAAGLGVKVAASWCPPLGMAGLWTRPVRRAVAGLGRFDEVVVWTPGAVAAAKSLGLPIVDRSHGEGWPELAVAGGPGMPRGEARASLTREAGFTGMWAAGGGCLVAVVWDPPGVADALTAAYGVGLIERAELLGPVPAAVVMPAGARGLARAERLTSGAGQRTVLAGVASPLGPRVSGADVVVVPPVEGGAGEGLRAARAWWIARALEAGVPVVASEGDDARAVRLPVWGRAELGRALRGVLAGWRAEAPVS